MYLKVYTADTGPLKEQQVFDRLIRLVSEDRREKTISRKSIADSAASLGAGLLLSLATERMGLQGADEYIRYNEYGKPYYDLEAYGASDAFKPPRIPQVYFSISHSHGRVMCAVSDLEVGCDVELLRESVMKRASAMLHPGEAKELEMLTDEADRMKRFFRYWTIKESYVKALGCGYSKYMPMALQVKEERYEVSIEQDMREETHPCRFYEWDLYDGYRYACCVLAPDEETASQLPDEEPELTEIDLTEEY